MLFGDHCDLNCPIYILYFPISSTDDRLSVITTDWHFQTQMSRKIKLKLITASLNNSIRIRGALLSQFYLQNENLFVYVLGMHCLISDYARKIPESRKTNKKHAKTRHILRKDNTF